MPFLQNGTDITTANWAKLSDYSMFVTAPTLLGFGQNNSGQLAVNTTTNYSSPVVVGGLTKNFLDAKLTRNGLGLVLIGQNNKVYFAGGPVFDTTHRSSPTQVASATNWAQVVDGWYFGVGIQSNSTLWAWGSNSYGQLGLSDPSNNRSSPVQIGNLSNWAIAAAGNQHAMGIQSNGTLWEIGRAHV